MAVVTTSLLSTLSRTTLIKPPDNIREWGPLPRAMLNFEVTSGVLDAKPLNDQQTLTIAIILPVSFAYRLVDANVQVDQDVSASWDVNPTLEVVNAIRGLPLGVVNRHPWVLLPSFRAAVAPVAMVTMRSPRQPAYIMQSIAQGIAPVITFRASNVTDPAGLAGLVFAYFSFLEYDIEQAQRFPIHYPQTVFDR